MHTKTHQVLRKGSIAIISFLSGVVITVVAAATYDATVQERATKMLTAIKSNAADLTSEDAVAYYSLVRENIKTLIAVLTEVDKGLVALSSDINLIPNPGTTSGTTNPGTPGTGSGTTGSGTTGGIVCTGTNPKSDPNATFFPNGPTFSVGGSTDQTNRVWKYQYWGTCRFDCLTGYTYNSSSNTCEKNTYSWVCGATTGGDPAIPANCNEGTVGTRTNSNCICTLSGGPKGNPIAFTVPEGVFDMAAPKSLTTRLPNVKVENLLLCQEVITHPLASVVKNEGACQNSLAYTKFPGSPGWVYTNGGYDITVPYDAAIWGAAGIKTRFFLKDKTTNQVATYTISVKNTSTTGTSPGTGTSPTNPSTPNPPAEVVCTGPVPATNVIKTTMPSSVGVGDWNNRVWQYQYGGSCSWRCEYGYTPSPSKTSCIQKAPGSGVSVTIVDKNGAPISGVALSLIYGPNHGEGTWETNPNGFVEFFPENSYPTAVLSLRKSGYIIYSANGCTSRNGVSGTLDGQAYSYCDGTPVTPGSKITITMMPTPTNFQNFVFQGLSNGEGSFYINDTRNHLISTSISGISVADTLSCMEILAHPNRPDLVNPGNCSNSANFSSFTGNDEWVWSPNNGGTWTGNIKYSDAVYGAAGIRVKIFMKNKSTNQVASFVIAVYKL